MTKGRKTKEKVYSVEYVLDEIKKRFGEDSVMFLDSKPNVDVEAISTGSIGLDKAIGIGGFPRGRVVEIFGAESSGKTTLSLHVIAEAQKKGGMCAFIDAEHALDPQYARRLGVDTSKLIISQPDGGVQALNILEALVSSKKISVVVIDSVASLTPQSEMEGEIGSMQIGAQARLMSQALRMLTAIVSKTNTLVIFINQIRKNIGMYGNPNTTAGGTALKFYSSVRVEVARITSIKKGDEVMGGKIRAKVVKNKVGCPFKFTEYDLMFNEGISREGEIMALGEKHGLIKKTGMSYFYGDVKIGVGYEKSREFLRENIEISSEIIEKISSLADDD